MKTYTVTLKLEEGSDEFWESIQDRPGCDEVLALVRKALDAYGLCDDCCEATLTKFESA